MRQADILYKGEVAGLLTQHNDGTFSFTYNEAWMSNSQKPAVSLTLPKITRPYHSETLFPAFINMLPEGFNKQIICKSLRIDENDYFGLLLNVAEHDAIGAITVKRTADSA
ncbi:serine/threonine-protein kinase HipA [Dyadobacter soli]|uniref:Serine/threonine-protein kinase HipA n=1 Tax=Dyadobacter soli TaxID=659014 RepID=A0A1G7BAG6_9BACT|nr:HipA N-terminal domain-containing protein [Dyadobacter soli]SDE24104.1 serine/threonine-protein kinase HipA [Dyadobacter soli]